MSIGGRQRRIDPLYRGRKIGAIKTQPDRSCRTGGGKRRGTGRATDLRHTEADRTSKQWRWKNRRMGGWWKL
ncbi:hypothetical protein IFM89_000612 [Coptis chinensis]|uniref:Uncharacterized protein n=1 Tax=Coptis chinensis TaxID=261450 RepID=A0A835LL39_9MAGN|nr:hypothetical protein IFM89_000612 [Coptis chinensis]